MSQSGVNYDPLSPLSFIRRSAFVFRDRPAVAYGDRVYSYSEFGERTEALARALRDAGVRAGDRVATLLPNIPPMVEAHFGVPRLGAVLVTLNTRISTEEIHYILDHCGAKALIVDTELAPSVKDVLDDLRALEIVIHVADPAAKGATWTPPGPEYEAFLASATSEPVDWVLEDELTPIAINYTSGTTGKPKGVLYTHRGATLNSYGEVMEMGLDPYTAYLWTLPMFHCNGWCFSWAVTAAGGVHVCLRYPDGEVILEEIEHRKVTHFCAAPVLLRMILAKQTDPDYVFPHPILIVTAGAPPAPTLIHELESLGARITHVYGLTETYGPFTSIGWQPDWDAASPEERAHLKARQGVPYIQSGEVMVADDDFNPVPHDGETMGEVMLRGNGVMGGYYLDPNATAAAFENGWFHTGDIAIVNPDGYMELRDRAKDIIISGGENISTIEIENVLYKHPAVAECAVVAAPDDRWGEVPKAFVTLKPGVGVTAEEIIEFCKGGLAKFKVPKGIEFGDLPKTATGKIRKNVLRDKEWAGVKDRIRG